MIGLVVINKRTFSKLIFSFLSFLFSLKIINSLLKVDFHTTFFPLENNETSSLKKEYRFKYQFLKEDKFSFKNMRFYL